MKETEARVLVAMYLWPLPWRPTVRELAHAVDRSKPSTHGAIRQLVAQGLVVIGADSASRCNALTADGLARARQMHAQYGVGVHRPLPEPPQPDLWPRAGQRADIKGLGHLPSRRPAQTVTDL